MKLYKKKILFFLFSLAGGGAERTVVNIINNLDRDKFEPLLVLCTKKNDDYIDLISNDIRIVVLNSPKLRYSLFRLRKCIIKESPDILFSTINNNNIILLLAKVFSMKRIPVIVREANNRTQSGKVTRINRFITNLTYNYLAQKVIALSIGVKKDLIINFNVDKDKIKVIYNPVEIKKIKELSEKPINDLKFNNYEKIIIAIGRLVEQKDYPTLLKAFSIVTKAVKSKLVILGKGPLEKKLKKLSKQLNISDKIMFLGFKKNPYKYMKKADIFVLSSKWEGFGHVIVEAMACGTPVVSTDCESGPSEIIGDNEYGILTPVGDYETLAKKIVNLLLDNKKRNMLSKKALKRAEEFDAKTIVKKYEKVFEDVYENSKKCRC